MSLKRMTVVLFMSSISFCSITCGKTHRSMATPRDALLTVRSALRDKDLPLFKQTLSAGTLASLASETKPNESVDDLLKSLLDRSEDSEGTPDVEEEQRIDENTVELRGKNGRTLGRFVREGNEWKMEGFGWRMRNEKPGS